MAGPRLGLGTRIRKRMGNLPSPFPMAPIRSTPPFMPSKAGIPGVDTAPAPPPLRPEDLDKIDPSLLDISDQDSSFPTLSQADMNDQPGMDEVRRIEHALAPPRPPSLLERLGGAAQKALPIALSGAIGGTDAALASSNRQDYQDVLNTKLLEDRRKEGVVELGKARDRVERQYEMDQRGREKMQEEAGNNRLKMEIARQSRSSAAPTVNVTNPSGIPRTMQWNPDTRQYDIEVGGTYSNKAGSAPLQWDVKKVPGSITNLITGKSYKYDDPSLPPEAKQVVDSYKGEELRKVVDRLDPGIRMSLGDPPYGDQEGMKAYSDRAFEQELKLRTDPRATAARIYLSGRMYPTLDPDNPGNVINTPATQAAGTTPGRPIDPTKQLSLQATVADLDRVTGLMKDEKALKALDQGYSQRFLISNALSDSQSHLNLHKGGVGYVMGTALSRLGDSTAARFMSPESREYVTRVLSFREQLMGLNRMLTGSSGTTDSRVAAIWATAPGAEGDSDMARRKMDLAEQMLNNLKQGVPSVPNLKKSGKAGQQPSADPNDPVGINDIVQRKLKERGAGGRR